MKNMSGSCRTHRREDPFTYTSAAPRRLAVWPRDDNEGPLRLPLGRALGYPTSRPPRPAALWSDARMRFVLQTPRKPARVARAAWHNIRMYAL